MNEKSNNNKMSPSRRDFMKTSSLAMGGLLLHSLPLSASAYVQGSDTLKVAIIGCGGRGTGAIFDFLDAGDGIKLVAMADVFKEKIDECYNLLYAKYGNTEKLDVPDDRKFVGFDAYKHAIALADVVVLTTPPAFRPAHFEESVKQGKHAFLEKPVATDAPGVRSILESGKIAKQKGLNVLVGLQRRYQKSYLEILRRVQNKEVGDILSGQVSWNSGGVWVKERKPEYSELEYQMVNWYYFTWLSGDHILEQHIHNIDIANWYLGEYPVSAQGMGGRQVRTGKEFGQIFDHHFVEFTYPSGAVIASQCRHFPGAVRRVAEIFQGTRGFIYTDERVNAIIRDRNKNIRYEHDGSNDPSSTNQLVVEMVDSIKKGNVIDNSEYGAKATLTALMGRMATYSGQIIRWEDALNATQRLVPKEIDWDTPPPVMPDENGYYPVPVPGQTNVLV